MPGVPFAAKLFSFTMVCPHREGNPTDHEKTVSSLSSAFIHIPPIRRSCIQTTDFIRFAKTRDRSTPALTAFPLPLFVGVLHLYAQLSPRSADSPPADARLPQAFELPHSKSNSCTTPETSLNSHSRELNRRPEPIWTILPPRQLTSPGRSRLSQRRCFWIRGEYTSLTSTDGGFRCRARHGLFPKAVAGVQSHHCRRQFGPFAECGSPEEDLFLLYLTRTVSEFFGN